LYDEAYLALHTVRQIRGIHHFLGVAVRLGSV
jgi:hypothetical protein